jgi:hypothetical protein
MIHIGKRKSIECIINTVGTFVSKKRMVFKLLLCQNECSVFVEVKIGSTFFL